MPCESVGASRGLPTSAHILASSDSILDCGAHWLPYIDIYRRARAFPPSLALRLSDTTCRGCAMHRRSGGLRARPSDPRVNQNRPNHDCHKHSVKSNQ